MSRLQFNPSILAILITVFFAGLFISLGDWQLDRAEEKSQLLERQQAKSASPRVTLPPSGTVGGDIDEWRYRPIRATLEWLPEKQFLLDNQVRQRVAGFNVLTPARRLPDGDIVLVDRGWVRQGATREDLPVLRDLDDVAAAVTLDGSVYAPFEDGFRLDDNASVGASGWPRVIQFIDFADISGLLGASVAPFVIRMSPEADSGFTRQWASIPFSPDKHIAYAWQWFGLAAAVIALFFALNIKKKRTEDDADAANP